MTIHSAAIFPARPLVLMAGLAPLGAQDGSRFPFIPWIVTDPVISHTRLAN